MSNAKATGRILEIDLLRFTAAAAVVVYHYSGVGNGQLLQLGFLGVPLFFMISGFVILWTASTKSGLEFVASRLCRLYPSFWICVLITALVWHAAGGPVTVKSLLANLTMEPTLFRQTLLDPVYWTLFLEIEFYALVFILVVSNQLTRMRWWLAIWLMLSIAAAALPKAAWLQRISLQQYSTYFIAGCYLYLIRTQGRSAALMIPLCASVFLGVHNAVVVQFGFTHDATQRMQWLVGATILVECLVFLLVALRRWTLPNWPLWGWLGAMTYPLYLIHDRAAISVATWLPAGTGIRIIGMTVFSVAIAWLLAATIERRGCHLLTKWLLRRVRRSHGNSPEVLRLSSTD